MVARLNLLLFIPLLLRAETYYVAQSGSDLNQGTEERPFRHLSKAADIAMAGDYVIVRDGTYDNENVTAPGYVVTLRHSGTPLKPITFMAENRGGAVLDAMNTVTGSEPCDGASAYFNLANASFVVISGFVITRGCDEGIHNNDRAHNILIRENEIHHIANRIVTDTLGRMAMGCGAGSHDITVEGNVIHDIGRTNASRFDHGLYMNCSNLTISNNVFYNQNSGWDIQLADGANNVAIVNNTFASHSVRDVGQIMVWDAHIGLTIQKNIFYNPNRYAITHWTASVADCHIENNLVSGKARIYDGPGCSVGRNTMHTDPMFVDANSHDFRLRDGSPAMAAGVGASLMPQIRTYLKHSDCENGRIGARAPAGPLQTWNNSRSFSQMRI